MAAKWHRRILPLVAAALLIPFLSEAKVYLVSVGVSDYPGSSMDLALPANDARTITWIYSKNSRMQYCMLLDEDATRAKVLAAMDKVFTMAGTDDIVVFFFSGHGFPGGFCAYDGNISYQDIRNAMARSRCRNKMIFADACFSGKIRTGGSSSRSEMAAAKKANVMLFLSSRSDEVSMENTGMSNGFFTTYLQKGLRGGADANKDRIITASELFSYVHANVVKISRGNQHPVMWGRFSDNMPVMIWK